MDVLPELDKSFTEGWIRNVSRWLKLLLDVAEDADVTTGCV
jgi:hypothetical protein